MYASLLLGVVVGSEFAFVRVCVLTRLFDRLEADGMCGVCPLDGVEFSVLDGRQCGVGCRDKAEIIWRYPFVRGVDRPRLLGRLERDARGRSGPLDGIEVVHAGGLRRVAVGDGMWTDVGRGPEGLHRWTRRAIGGGRGAWTFARMVGESRRGGGGGATEGGVGIGAL